MVRQAHHPEQSRGKAQNAQKGQKKRPKKHLFWLPPFPIQEITHIIYHSKQLEPNLIVHEIS